MINLYSHFNLCRHYFHNVQHFSISIQGIFMVFEKKTFWRENGGGYGNMLKLRSGGPHFGRSEADSKWKILSWMDQDLLYQVTPSSRYHTRVSTKQRSRSDPSLVKITCWNIRIQKRETNQWFQWNRQFYQWINEIL